VERNGEDSNTNKLFKVHHRLVSEEANLYGLIIKRVWNRGRGKISDTAEEKISTKKQGMSDHVILLGVKRRCAEMGGKGKGSRKGGK